MMEKTKPIVDLARVHSSSMSAEDFLELLLEREQDIKHVRFVPPRLGKKGFGSFRVEWKWPKYV